MTDLRALTVHPEWGFGIHYLGKRDENRGGPPPITLTGDDPPWIALHAGKHIGGRPGKVAKREGLEALVGMAQRAGWTANLAAIGPTAWGADFDGPVSVLAYDPADVPSDACPDRADYWATDSNPHPIHTGAVLGLFRIVDFDYPHRGEMGPWRVPEAFAYRIDYHPLPAAIPVPYRKGDAHQGWWKVPAGIAAQITEPKETT